jgi:hypothetical protein
MSCYNIITIQLYEQGRCLNVYVLWYMCGNSLWNYLNKILSNGHFVYKEARSGLDLWPGENTLWAGHIGGFHF